MKPSVEQLLMESGELNARLSKLEEFMASDEFLDLDPEGQSLIIDQQYHMEEYLNILNKRINHVTDK